MHKHWLIEDPETNQLTDKITLTLNPNAAQTIVFVLKSPFLKHADLISQISISAGSYKQKNLANLDQQKVENSMKVILCGRLENPIVKCNKSIFDEATQTHIIPLAVQINAPI